MGGFWRRLKRWFWFGAESTPEVARDDDDLPVLLGAVGPERLGSRPAVPAHPPRLGVFVAGARPGCSTGSGSRCYADVGDWDAAASFAEGEEKWMDLVRERCADGRNPFLGR